MPTVKVTELKNRATQIMRRVQKGTQYVVTRRGAPVGVILPIAEEELEDWILAKHPEAVRRRQEAEAEIAAGEYVTGKELRALLRRTKRELAGRS